MTYSSPLNNQDGISRTLSISESENNRIHKEVADGELDKHKKLQKDEDKDQQVNDLKEQEQLDSDGQGPEQNPAQKGHGSAQQVQQNIELPPAHLGGGDFVDFSA